MEEKDSIDTEYSKYKSVLSILGIGNRKNKLDPTMDTTIEELKKLWNTEYPYSIDDIDSSGSIVGSIDPNTIRTPKSSSSDEPPQPKVSKLTIEGLHKLEGNYRSGKITDTLHNNDYYIVELLAHSIPIEATIYREPLEDSKIRIDIRESGKASVRYHTHREGFRNRKDFAMELFSLADDYIEGEYYK
jgi:hypothetical protein